MVLKSRRPAFSSNYNPCRTAYKLTGSELFRYTGKPCDSVTWLYCFMARYYDPTIGRFVRDGPSGAP